MPAPLSLSVGGGVAGSVADGAAGEAAEASGSSGPWGIGPGEPVGGAGVACAGEVIGAGVAAALGEAVGAEVGAGSAGSVAGGSVGRGITVGRGPKVAREVGGVDGPGRAPSAAGGLDGAAGDMSAAPLPGEAPPASSTTAAPMKARFRRPSAARSRARWLRVRSTRCVHSAGCLRAGPGRVA